MVSCSRAAAASMSRYLYLPRAALGRDDAAAMHFPEVAIGELVAPLGLFPSCFVNAEVPGTERLEAVREDERVLLGSSRLMLAPGVSIVAYDATLPDQRARLRIPLLVEFHISLSWAETKRRDLVRAGVLSPLQSARSPIASVHFAGVLPAALRCASVLAGLLPGCCHDFLQGMRCGLGRGGRRTPNRDRASTHSAWPTGVSDARQLPVRAEPRSKVACRAV